MADIFIGNSGTIAVVVSIIGTVFVLANYFLGPKYDVREPPIIRPKVPLVGHIIGLLRHGLRYFEIIRWVPDRFDGT